MPQMALHGDVRNMIAQHDALIRLGIFLAVLFIIMLFEKFFPRRKLSYSRSQRWPSNLLLVFFNGVLVRLVFPVVAVGVAVLAQEKGWGLFNNLSIYL